MVANLILLLDWGGLGRPFGAAVPIEPSMCEGSKSVASKLINEFLGQKS